VYIDTAVCPIKDLWKLKTVYLIKCSEALVTDLAQHLGQSAGLHPVFSLAITSW
jgi:hypothetical protein